MEESTGCQPLGQREEGASRKGRWAAHPRKPKYQELGGADPPARGRPSGLRHSLRLSHLPRLHARVWMDGPKQVLLVTSQDRPLCWVPGPQVAEHSVHSAHGDQPSSLSTAAEGDTGPRQDSTSDGRRTDPRHTTGPMPLERCVSASEGGDALVVGTGPNSKQQEFPMSAPRPELRGCSPGGPCAGRSRASVAPDATGAMPLLVSGVWVGAMSGLHELYCSCQDFHLTSKAGLYMVTKLAHFH